MSSILSEKAQEYIKKNKITKILIDVDFIEESCTQIFDPIIKILKNSAMDKYEDFEKIMDDNYIIYISKSFIEKFGKLNEYKIEICGFFKKVLVLTNVDPIIKNICRNKKLTHNKKEL